MGRACAGKLDVREIAQETEMKAVGYLSLQKAAQTPKNLVLGAANAFASLLFGLKRAP